MRPVTNYNTINKRSQPISEPSSRKKHLMPEEENFPIFRKKIEQMIQVRQNTGLKKLVEGLTRTSEKKGRQVLGKLANPSLETGKITSNIANIGSLWTNRFFYPVRNGFRNEFYCLTRDRDSVAGLFSENTISNTEPTNQTSIDEKKPYKRTQDFYDEWRIISFAGKWTKDLVLFIWDKIKKLIVKINFCFYPK